LSFVTWDSAEPQIAKEWFIARFPFVVLTIAKPLCFEIPSTAKLAIVRQWFITTLAIVTAIIVELFCGITPGFAVSVIF
jgi:hypothetical protein